MKTHIITTRQKQIKIFSFFCFIMLFATTIHKTQAQNNGSTKRTVSGIVKTLDGPLPYASVVLKGSVIGITTNDDGTFTFPKKLKDNDVLVVSSLAYDSYEITIGSDTTFVQPFLEGSPIVIVGSLRAKNGKN